MSADPRFILEVIPPGPGSVLDLGGGKGLLRKPLTKRGFQYLNLDLLNYGNGEPSIIGNAQQLPFKDLSFDLVISKDTMEHFLNPWAVVNEVHRVLKNDGQFVIWVPFMHPFHGDDFYRYSPMGLRHLLTDFDITWFDSPLWLFYMVGMAGLHILKRFHLGFLEPNIRSICARCDHFFMSKKNGPASFAAAYRLVARKR